MYDPNVGCEVLTLANCKPPIRTAAKKCEWIAGITPTRMTLRLAYLMQVNDKLRREQYWARYNSTRFDSIYRPRADGGWFRFKNSWHMDEESFKTDLSSDFVLRNKTFCMFANSYTDHCTEPHGLKLDQNYLALARGGMRGYGHFIELPNDFLSWIEQQPRLALKDFTVLREFVDGGCGCSDEEEAVCEAGCSK